jgi:hypothetical protein
MFTSKRNSGLCLGKLLHARRESVAQQGRHLAPAGDDDTPGEHQVENRGPHPNIGVYVRRQYRNKSELTQVDDQQGNGVAAVKT